MAPLFVPKDRKSLFRQFLAGMYDAVVITDPSGHILEINPRAAEHFGYQQDEVVDQPISMVIPGLTPDIVQRIRKGLDEDRHVMIDANGRSKSGARFACEVAISPIEMTDPDDLVFTVRSVERRRRILELLRAKEAAFNVAHSALFTCDSTGRFTSTNKEFRDMFDIPSEEAAEKLTFAEVLSDDPLPANFKKALDGISSTVGIVAENESDDDEEIEIVLAPNKLGRKVLGVVGSVTKV
jgi:PAS domain S-box-containing protein